jgi:hypothetical protein
VRELLLERALDQEANAAGVKERKARRRLKEESQAEHVTVESNRAVEVLHRDRDLTDGG